MTKHKKHRSWKQKLKRWTKASLLLALRLSLFVGMLVLLLFAAAWICFIRLFNAQHISEVIAAELQKRLNRPVAIASLDLASINSLELKGFRVLDTEGVPGQDLLAADSVTLRFKLFPLLEQHHRHQRC